MTPSTLLLQAGAPSALSHRCPKVRYDFSLPVTQSLCAYLKRIPRDKLNSQMRHIAIRSLENLDKGQKSESASRYPHS
jgi:hypothetical protein